MPKTHTSVRMVSGAENSYTAEAKLVQQRAERRAASVIRLGPIVFFSTATGDAWMLDAKDGESACLARDGEPEPIPIEETSTKFGIAWEGRYRIEGDTFVVIGAEGTARAILGYPCAEIQRLIDEHPVAESPASIDVDAARERLRETGRNDPCPCSSGRKYKKCCLPRDEELARGTAAHSSTASLRRAEFALDEEGTEDTPGAGDTDDGIDVEATSDGTPCQGPSEVESEPPSVWASSPPYEGESRNEPAVSPAARDEANRLWNEFERLAHPTREQMDSFLDRFLALPPAAMDWNDLFATFAQHQHADLPDVFRRIVAQVPSTKDSAMSFLYWTAIDEFLASDRTDLVPEVLAHFRELGRDTYDADALSHVGESLLAAGMDKEALALAEHFLPVLRSDDGLMPHAVPETCQEIHTLRVGMRLRDWGAHGLDPAALACELHRDLGEDISRDYTDRAARVICSGGSSAGIMRDVFALARGDARESEETWQEALGRFEALMHVAHEALEFEHRPPGGAFFGLWQLLLAFDDECAERPAKHGESSLNLLDCLRPTGMERRVAQSARGLMGTNVPRAEILLEAHADLRRFAARHALIDEALAAKSEANVAILRKKLGVAR